MVEAVCSYNKWGVVVLEKGDGGIVGYGECVGYLIICDPVGWV